MTKKLEGRNNTHFSQTDTKPITSVGRFDVIIYLNILLSLSWGFHFSSNTVSGVTLNKGEKQLWKYKIFM